MVNHQIVIYQYIGSLLGSSEIKNIVLVSMNRIFLVTIAKCSIYSLLFEDDCTFQNSSVTATPLRDAAGYFYDPPVGAQPSDLPPSFHHLCDAAAIKASSMWRTMAYHGFLLPT